MLRYLGLLILLIPCTVTDIRRREIPVGFVLLFALSAVVINLNFSSEIKETDMFFGLLAGLALAAASLISRGAVGMGDAVMLLSAGVWCGGGAAIAILLGGLTLSAITGAAAVLLRKGSAKSALPFAPFLLASATAWLVISLCISGSAAPIWSIPF